MEISSLRREKWSNFNWKSLKWPSKKTKIPLFLLISSVIWRKWLIVSRLVWGIYNAFPPISLEVSIHKRNKWWNFSWKIIKLTFADTKISHFSPVTFLYMTRNYLYWYIGLSVLKLKYITVNFDKNLALLIFLQLLRTLISGPWQIQTILPQNC